MLLPTGSGKSLIYQLAGLLMPGTTLVVDPLVSLIDDQEQRLVRDGIDRVVALHGSRGGDKREQRSALAAVARGEPLFLFITPERLQIQQFRDRLRESADHQLINLAVIDEAHTVSEWGHDFRTSYLRLARNVRRLCEDARGVWPPMLALTGTAGPAVLRDVLRELQIDAAADGALQRPASHDRPNLHFLKVTGDEAGWMDLVRHAVTETVPQSLGVELADLAAVRGPETLSGIVFCPWAGGEHGVDRIRDAVVQAFRAVGVDLPAETYSGRSPKDEQRRVHADRKTRTAAAFKENEVPLLVATKAFGMGIDKPNIRYTIHAGFPSSIEAFAQEAGRAGRDGREAYCILTTALPDHKSATRLLDRGLAPPERRKSVDETRRPDRSDLTRQLWFYGNSFPGPEEEADRGVKLCRWLVAHGGGPGGQAAIPLPPLPGEEPKDHDARKGQYDRALFRLASLGIVDDVTVENDDRTVYLADYTAASIDTALLAYLSRIEPGNEATHRRFVAAAPAALDTRIEAHMRTLSEAIYRIVAAARLAAIENMYDLARGSDDPDHLRSRINAYLGDGHAAVVLAKAVAMAPIVVAEFVAWLDGLQAADAEGLAGAAARQREAYPDHPLLWLATALAVSRDPGAEAGRFRDAMRRSLETFATYEVPEDQAAEGARWLIGRLRDDNGGSRWEWAADVFEAWDEAGLGIERLQEAEDEALARARRGRYRERELSIVARRRLRRHARRAGALADRYADSAPADKGDIP